MKIHKIRAYAAPEDISESRMREGVRIAKSISGVLGKPTCEFDRKTGKAYLLYPDGHKEYYSPQIIEKAVKKASEYDD